MVIAVAPLFDRLKHSAHFRSALDGIFASFVGLLLFVCLDFAVAVPWDFARVLLGLAAFIAQTRQKPRGQPISIHLTEVARAEVFGLQEHV